MSRNAGKPASELLQPEPTEAAAGFGAALGPGGEESGPRDQSSGALGCLFIPTPTPPPENTTSESVPLAAVPSCHHGPLVDPAPPPQLPGTPCSIIQYRLLMRGESIPAEMQQLLLP